MSTTVRMKASEITKDWHVIDAAGRPLGRVASEAAILLRGKHKPTFEPHLDGGDFVIIVNASQVTLSGRKSEQMKYHRHSGYPGGLRTRTFTEQFARFPARVIEEAVWGMLPKGPLGKAIARHLKVYPGPRHPHESQVVGSERAKATREAALVETLTLQMKAPRLRPLSVPEVVEAPTAKEPKPAPPARKAAAPTRAGKPVEVSEPVVVETPTAEVPAAAPVAPEAAAPKRTRRTAEPAPAAAPEAAPKARAPRKKAETAEAPVEAAPKPRAARKKAETVEAATEAPVSEEKKPVRRRAAAKTEE